MHLIAVLATCTLMVFRAAGEFTGADLVVAQQLIEEELKHELDLIPELVRMIFHDCVGPNGCDGCIDALTPSNVGLVEVLFILEPLRLRIAPELSKADFNVLLGTEAVRLSLARARLKVGDDELPFSIGRPDCTTIVPDTELPLGDTLDTVQFFADQFGMTPREAVAIMGGHSLGHVHEENTGFDGHWDNSEANLDNRYYKNMIQKGWLLEQVQNLFLSTPVRSTQWSRKKKGENKMLMLLSDMILLKEYTVTGTFMTPSCGFNSCTDQPVTGPIVREFADDMVAFQQEFITAFLKMVSKTSGTLTVVTVPPAVREFLFTTPNPVTETEETSSTTAGMETTLGD